MCLSQLLLAPPRFSMDLGAGEVKGWAQMHLGDVGSGFGGRQQPIGREEEARQPITGGEEEAEGEEREEGEDGGEGEEGEEGEEEREEQQQGGKERPPPPEALLGLALDRHRSLTVAPTGRGAFRAVPLRTDFRAGPPCLPAWRSRRPRSKVRRGAARALCGEVGETCLAEGRRVAERGEEGRRGAAAHESIAEAIVVLSSLLLSSPRHSRPAPLPPRSACASGGPRTAGGARTDYRGTLITRPSQPSPFGPSHFSLRPPLPAVHARLADLLLLAAHEPSAALAGVQQRVHAAVPTLVALKADTLTCSREAEFAGADMADCHVIAHSMTAGGPASLQRMLARLAAAKPLLPSLRGAKDVPPPSLHTARAARDLSHTRALPSEGGALSRAAGGAVTGVTGEVEGVRAGSGVGVPTGSSERVGGANEADLPVMSAFDMPHTEGAEAACEAAAPLVSAPHEVPRTEGVGPEAAGRLVGLGSASDKAAREQSDERASESGGGDGSREEVVDGGEGGGLMKGEGEGGVAGEGGTRAEEDGMARGKGGNAVERGGAGGGVVEVVFSAAASRTDDVAAVASSSDVASMGSGADVAGARVAVADRAGVRRALMGPAALLAFINDGAEDTAEDASIGAATTGDAQTSYHPPHHSHLSCHVLPPYIPLTSSLLSSLACPATPSISSRLLRLISPPSLLWQSQQPLRKKAGGSSELPHGNKIGEEQRLRLEAWLDDK
ncbi:unnamed protein product [Closterium sp. Naga37s-1]|nr:unnamed protein product [Closterium sp. Naga37s-1]